MRLRLDEAAVFNVCTGQATSILELAHFIGKLAGQHPNVSHIPVRAGDIRHSLGDPTRMRKVLGLNHMVALRDGLGMLLAQIAQHQAQRTVLKSILLALALPPVSFLYCLMLGLLIVRRHRKRGIALVWLGLAGLTLLSIPLVPNLLIVALEQNLPTTPPPDAMPQAIVILGGDLMRNAATPRSLPGFLTLDRLREGAALYRRTGLPILVTGGTVQRDRPPVALIMADSLRNDFRVPVTWVEDASLDTWQNAAVHRRDPETARHQLGLCRDAGLAHAARHGGVSPCRPDRHGGADIDRHAIRSDPVGSAAARIGLAMELLRVA